MNDPFGSFTGMMNQFTGFMRNPMQFMMSRNLNVPNNMMGDPDRIIQHLMNNGQMSQDQYNQLQKMAKQIQNNPQFSQIMGSGNR